MIIPISIADIDDCMSVDTCGPHSICSNTVGSFSCQCDSGYRTNGSMCVGKYAGTPIHMFY